MKRRRGKVFALFAIAAAVVLATGTGAFSTVSAERTVDVALAGDDSALLRLTPHNGPNGVGGYATTVDGRLQIRLDGTAGGSNFASEGSGVNLDARTEVTNVFNVTNQGTQSVGVWITKSGNHTGLVMFYDGAGNRIDDNATVAQPIAPGETIQVSIRIDTRGSDLTPGESILDGISIHADADEA